MVKEDGIMKRSILVLAITVFTVALSCNKAEVPIKESKVAVNISVGELEPSTKAVKTGWSNGDIINIWFDNRCSLTPDLTLTYNGTTWAASEMSSTVVEALKPSGAIKGFWEATNSSASSGWGPRNNGHEFYYDGAYSNYNTGNGVKGYLTIGFSEISYTFTEDVLTANLDSFYYLSNLQVVVSGNDVPSGDYYLYSDQINCLYRLDIYNTSYMRSNITFDSWKGSEGHIAGISNTDGLAFVGRLRAANDGTSANYEIFLKNRTTGKLYKTTKESTTLSSSGSTKLCAVKIPFSKFTEVTP